MKGAAMKAYMVVIGDGSEATQFAISGDSVYFTTEAEAEQVFKDVVAAGVAKETVAVMKIRLRERTTDRLRKAAVDVQAQMNLGLQPQVETVAEEPQTEAPEEVTPEETQTEEPTAATKRRSRRQPEAVAA